jgi:SanA protein
LSRLFLFAVLAVVGLPLGLLALGGIGHAVLAAYGRAYATGDIARLPPLEVALVPGTQPWDDDGDLNIDLERRCDGAVVAWRAGKVRRIIVSGNRIGRDYDEPAVMMRVLLDRGVPAAAIERDDLGRRTWHSVQRARDVYGLRRVLIVSQRGQLDRALFLARHAGMEAWGLDVDERQQSNSLLYFLYVDLSLLRTFADAVLDVPARRERP